MKYRKRAFLIAGLMCLGIGSYYTFAPQFFDRDKTAAVSAEGTVCEMDECIDGKYYALHDIDSQEHIEHMSRIVNEGDELITAENKHYKVMRIEDHKAHCQYIGDVGFDYSPAMASEYLSVAQDLPRYQAVAIYTTHTDESYVPSSGTESIEGGGDILSVAGMLAETLEAQGVTVVHSENIHDPHDKNAYQRSRETATQLLKVAPAIMIDVHRDGVPDPEYYEAELDGKEITQIRLVVGKANDNSEANLEFAEKMKAYYDSVKPGLVKSIYMAKGNYNQDIAPHSILLEVGTHTNTVEQAMAGAEEFGAVLPEFLGIADSSTETSPFTSKEAADTTQTEDSNSGKVIWILLGIALVGGIAFLFMNKGAGNKK